MAQRNSEYFFPCNPTSAPEYSGISIRLEVAARMMAVLGVDEKVSEKKAKELAVAAFKCADALIEAYNEKLAAGI